MIPDPKFMQFGPRKFDSLKVRLRTLIRLFNENKFPFSQVMLGFGRLNIDDREECFGRIKELSDITGRQIKLTKIENPEGVEYKIE